MIILKSIKLSEDNKYILYYDYWDKNITDKKIIRCESNLNEYLEIETIPAFKNVICPIYIDLMINDLKNIITISKLEEFIEYRENFKKLQCGKTIKF